MESNEQFNAPAYFKMLAEKNKLAVANKFKAIYASPESMLGVLDEYRKVKNFVLVDDTCSQNTFSKGHGFFDRQVYSVMILAGYRMDDMDDRQEALKLCRRIFRQMHSRMINDKFYRKYGDMLEYLDVNTVASRELDRYFLNGVTGLTFFVNNIEPTDLTFNKDEWED